VEVDAMRFRLWLIAVTLLLLPLAAAAQAEEPPEGQAALPATADAPSFSDVSSDFWAFDEIEACAAAGVVQGFPNGTYRPGLVVTRDQMAVYISRAMVVVSGSASAQVPTGPAEPTFHDVGVDQWAYQYIEFCAAEGVVQGYPGGSYRPSEPVNRGQMAVYIARSITIPTGAPDPDDFVPSPGSTFPDVTADNEWAWCFQYVEYIADLDIVLGYPDGTYRPEEVMARDQMAVYIQRAFHLPME
jgi:hypothetical protein